MYEAQTRELGYRVLRWHISMYQQYLILHIDLQLTIYPKLSVIFNTLSSNEFFTFKSPQGLNVYQHKLLQKNYASKPSKFKMRHLKINLAMFRDVLRKES